MMSWKKVESFLASLHGKWFLALMGTGMAMAFDRPTAAIGFGFVLLCFTACILVQRFRQRWTRSSPVVPRSLSRAAELSPSVAARGFTAHDRRNAMERNKKSDLRVALLVLSPAMLGMLILVAAISWHDLKGTWLISSDSLAGTRGTITSSSMYYKSGSRSSGWYYDIKYEFKVNGRTYRSNKVRFGYTGTRDRSFAESYVQKYPAGSTVTIYYDKGNPSFSVLEPNFKDPDMIVLPIGIALSLAAFLWALISWTNETKRWIRKHIL